MDKTDEKIGSEINDLVRQVAEKEEHIAHLAELLATVQGHQNELQALTLEEQELERQIEQCTKNTQKPGEGIRVEM